MSDIVLLDTNIVGGLICNNPTKSKLWSGYIKNMVSTLSDPKLAIPTPVWFEIAQWKKSLHTQIHAELNAGKKMYKYAGDPIPNKILMDAAWYLCEVRGHENSSDTSSMNNRDKISFIDALIAAHCLEHNYFILTMNHQDFPEKFFEIITIKNTPKGTALHRHFGSLLKPKMDEWQQSRK